MLQGPAIIIGRVKFRSGNKGCKSVILMGRIKKLLKLIKFERLCRFIVKKVELSDCCAELKLITDIKHEDFGKKHVWN